MTTPGLPGRRRLAVLGTGVVGLAAAITAVVALGALERVGVAPPPASAAEILDRAADAARAEPDPVPRPDQFLYVRSQRGETLHHEMWLSVNAVYKGDLPLPGVTEPCVPAPQEHLRTGRHAPPAAGSPGRAARGGDRGRRAPRGAGRPGIGVRWQTEAGPYTMVFDKEGYAFLGMSEFGALMAKGFVNEVGERP